MSLLLLLLLLSNTIFVFGGHENCPTNALKNILEKQTPEVTVVERHKNVSSSSTKFRYLNNNLQLFCYYKEKLGLEGEKGISLDVSNFEKKNLFNTLL